MENIESKSYKEAYELEKQGDFSRAIQKYQELLKQNPRSLNLLQSIGKCYLKKKDFSSALDYFQKIIRIYPSEENFYNQAECYISLNKMVQAVESLKKALSINPAYLKANILLSKIYSQTGNFFNQEKYLQMILKFDPKNTFAIKEMALLCEKTYRYKEALSYIEGYIYQAEQQLIEAEVLRVKVLLGMGKYATAYEYLSEALQSNLSFANGLSRDAKKLINQKIKELQLKLKQGSLEKKPILSFQIAWLYLMLENFDQSTKYLIYSKKLNEELKLSRAKIQI